MGFRFFRRLKIAPGLSLNFSKSGMSLSAGPRGAKFTVGPRGVRTTVGIPGTGLYYTETSPRPKTASRRAVSSASPPPPSAKPEDQLTLGFFKRLVVPAEEQALVDGMHDFVAGNSDAALVHLQRAAHLPDAAFVAGVIAVNKGDLAAAEGFLHTAFNGAGQLGAYFSKYGVAVNLSFSITKEMMVPLHPDIRGAGLAYVEVLQRLQKWTEAIGCLKRLWEEDAKDPVVTLSLIELYMDARQNDKDTCRETLKLTESVTNDSPLHAALLLYRARAMRTLGLFDAARETLSAALKKAKGCAPELLRALRYERALAHGDLGQQGRARKDLERLYAEAPGYEDVAVRLGLT
jgi:tetratricopeptide (TPR) repeat protein